MVRKAEITLSKNARGGEGTLEMHHILKPEELNGHGRFYAMVKFPPHSSIGVHEHIGETEPYYILSGHGIFIDNDGSRIPVGPGDVCLIECGQSHGLENNSDEELRLMALIYNE
ncbi:MAG: cupin domain-containing protein [Lachnospiraceae bacterium]|nr:cupin domain-containing protein [Lachnospiraceae bacterium]